jgi:hypothetical protein
VLAGLSLNAGDLWMLAVLLGLYTLGLKWRPAGLHPMALLATLTMIGLLVLAPLVWVELSSGAGSTSRPGPVWRRLYRDLSGLPRLRVLQPGSGRSRCFRAGLFIHLMPAFSTILAMLFLVKRPALPFFGIALILTGIWLTTRFKKG